MTLRSFSFIPQFFNGRSGKFLSYSREILIVSMLLITIQLNVIFNLHRSKFTLAVRSYQLNEAPVATPSAPTDTGYAIPGQIIKVAPALTQKEYLILLRNRLFSVEEQIWLHQYALAHPKGPRVSPLSASKYEELQRTRDELLASYPVTKLHSDLKEAQEGNMTYAAMYIDRLINTFNRQLPVSLKHTNQIAVVSFPGEVVNLMRGQGSVHHRLVPSNPLTERGKLTTVI